MRLRWILIPLGLLVVGAAVAYYLLSVPPQLADRYVDDAKPQHERVEAALRPVMDTFDFDTFGTPQVKSKKTAKAELRQITRVAARDLRELTRAKRALRKAKRAMARVDEESMTEAPDWPLLGGSDDVEAAAEIAEEESDYLRKARTFMKDYDRLVAYASLTLKIQRDMGVSFWREETRIPEAPTSAGQITGPLNRAIKSWERHLRRYKKLKPPAPLRIEHRNTLEESEFFIEQQRAISAAITRDDFNRVRAVERRLNAESKKARRDSRKDLQRLMTKSRYRRQIDDIEKRETAIAKLFEEI